MKTMNIAAPAARPVNWPVPNGTIKIITKFDITPEGKKKKAIDKLVYHLELVYHV